MSLWHVRVVELLTASDTMSPGEHELSAPTVTCSPLTSAGFVDTAQNLGEGFVVDVCSRLLHDVQVHTAIARSTLPTRTIGASCPEMGRARQYFMAVGGMLVVFDREVGRTDTSSRREVRSFLLGELAPVEISEDCATRSGGFTEFVVPFQQMCSSSWRQMPLSPTHVDSSESTCV